MLEQSIIEQILDAWVAIAKSRKRPEITQNVPNADDLKTLLEITFLASMKLEEGHPIQLRLVFFPEATPQSLPQHSGGGVDTFAFASPIALTVENLRKLAPAFDQDSTALVVARGTEARYTVIGALFYGRPMSRVEGHGGSGRPRALILSTRSPGNVAIAYSDSVLGRFQDGRFSIAKPDAMASQALYTHLLNVLGGHEPYQRHQMPYWYLYRDCLKRLYRSAAKFGHGGTIVWVPQGQLDRVTRDLRPGILISSTLSGSSLANFVLERNSREGDGPALAAYRRLLTDYLDMLARLSCVDGALVIDDCLAPYGFSVHLASEKWPDAVVEGPVGTFPPGQAIDLAGLGTRHNSAINFAGAHPGTIVFVVSEDGPVRTICRLEKSVLIWPDCLNTVFLDW